MFDFLKRRPDFLIVGAQKAGTSALESYLSEHPRIRCAKRKEVGFFSRDKCYRSGADWYEGQFPYRTRPGLLFFEATPEYLYYPFAAERIFQFHSRIKLIVLLRNPVERAFSAWNMFRQLHSDPVVRDATIKDYLKDANPDIKRPLLELLRGSEFPDFQACVENEIEMLLAGKPKPLEPSFVQRGLYADQVQRFYRQFPGENLLVLESAELREHRAMLLNRVLRFLGLRETDWTRTELPDKHVRPYDSTMPEQTRKTLQEFFQPHNAKLYSILGREFNWAG